MKKLSLIFLMLLGLNALAQSTFNVTGTVFDETGTPLPDATLRLVGSNFYTTSDADGVYEFDVVRGSYTLEVFYIGYATAKKEIEVNGHLKGVDFTLEVSNELLDEALVSAVRVNAASPVTHSNLSKEEIAKRNLGQDIPIIMNYLPSVVTTSDAGAGIGYTGIRVRGSDATRVNVTINGIPYNDSESMGTFWVNMPDFSSSVENIQLQRGVGTSTNGAGAFGATLSLLTDAVSELPYAQISASAGSYNTLRTNVKFSTGKINDHIELAGRLSLIKSDGYVDNAWSDLKSYFLQGSYVDDNTLIKALAFGGVEETYQAWFGVTAEDLENDRTKNYYTYDNEIDHYEQDHYQLHWNETFSDNFSTTVALHYTRGKGYFEQFKEDEAFSDYNLAPIVIGGETIDETDIIRRRWLDNHFFGYTFSLNYTNGNDFQATLGGAWNKYLNDHYGEIIWAEYASDSEIRDHYYDHYGNKTDYNIFAKVTYDLDDQWSLYGDLQYRRIGYRTNGVADGEIYDVFNFFNPKAGVTYQASEASNLYFSYARANREPNRTDYENGSPEPETLNDFELGWRWKKENFFINSNLYYMRYQNQLVLTGEIDDVGAPIRANVGDSYRLGIEIDALFNVSEKFSIQPNVALSTNKNLDFSTQWDGELVNLGNTNISFSPNIIAGNAFNYMPVENLQLSLLSKYVGEQYMGNVDTEGSILDAYFTSDFNANYELKTNKIAKSIVFSLLVNNIFNAEYESNGYYYTYDDTWSVPGETTTLDGAGYYPQATINFLAGATINF